ncbi:MAG: DUF4339 domain-containing protein, partial [Fuerstiella sp.]|nr:DUF4339 domain-containing protein [Fuerstiella sp.]
EVTELLRSIIISTFADVLGESKVAALDLASKYLEFGETLRVAVQERIDDEYGLEIPQLLIVNISLPEAVEKALDTRTSMGVIGDMNSFQQYQMGQAMTAAAENPSGGGAAEGMGLGMGFAMAGKMMQPGGIGGTPTAAPPPPPQSAQWHVAVNGQTQGPYGLPQLAAGISAGEVTPDTLVWANGMSGWTAASQVPQLSGSFSTPPPPPPPPAP